jgi:hypothetical protein
MQALGELLGLKAVPFTKGSLLVDLFCETGKGGAFFGGCCGIECMTKIRVMSDMSIATSEPQLFLLSFLLLSLIISEYYFDNSSLLF